MTQFGLLVVALLIFRPRGPWAIFLVISIACFWGAPVSLSGAYSPLPVHTRIVGPMICPALVVAARMAAKWSAQGGDRGIARGLMSVLLISGPQAIDKWGQAVRGRPEEPRAIAALQEALGRDGSRDAVLLTADPVSPKTLAIFFGLEYPSFLRVVQWADEELPLDAERYFFHENTPRVKSLKKYRGVEPGTPELRGDPIFLGADVRIVELDRDEVRNLITGR